MVEIKFWNMELEGESVTMSRVSVSCKGFDDLDLYLLSHKSQHSITKPQVQSPMCNILSLKIRLPTKYIF